MIVTLSPKIWIAYERKTLLVCYRDISPESVSQTNKQINKKLDFIITLNIYCTPVQVCINASSTLIRMPFRKHSWPNFFFKYGYEWDWLCREWHQVLIRLQDNWHLTPETSRRSTTVSPFSACLVYYPSLEICRATGQRHKNNSFFDFHARASCCFCANTINDGRDYIVKGPQSPPYIEQ